MLGKGNGGPPGAPPEGGVEAATARSGGGNGQSQPQTGAGAKATPAKTTRRAAGSTGKKAAGAPPKKAAGTTGKSTTRGARKPAGGDDSLEGPHA